MSANKNHPGWDLRESGPTDADHTVLLLPGSLCTAAFFEGLMAELRLIEAPIRLVAARLPGFGGTPPPEDIPWRITAGSRASSPPVLAAMSWLATACRSCPARLA